MMPWLAASEKGRGQTESPVERWAEMWWAWMPKSASQSPLERGITEGDNPVDKADMVLLKE